MDIPVHVQMMILVALAVNCPRASRHRPDSTLVIDPSALTFHCWLVRPLQGKVITSVPRAVLPCLTSRHCWPWTTNCLDAVCWKAWFCPPLQSHSWAWPSPVVLIG